VIAATTAVVAGVFAISTPAIAGTLAAPTTTDTGQVYDLISEFMFNNGNALVSPSDGNQIQQDLFEPAPTNKFYYVKQTDTTFWERYGITDTRIALERDTTAPPGSANNSYDAKPWGSLWMPRVWTVGTETSFSTTIKYYNKYNCTYSGSTVNWPDGRNFLRWQGPINMGGSLGTVDVVVIDRYHWLSNDPNNAAYYNPKEAERFWYARGRGWIRWDLFSNRTTGNWNKSDPATMLNPGGLSSTVSFINDSPGNNSKTPNKLCSSLVP
jgi:hypothetical protein